MSKITTYQRQKLAYIEFESLSREFDFRKSDLINLIQQNDLNGFNELTGKNLKKIESAKAYIRVLNRFEEKATNIDSLSSKEQKYYRIYDLEPKIDQKQKTYQKQSKFEKRYEYLQEREMESRSWDLDNEVEQFEELGKKWTLSYHYLPFYPKINGKNVSEEIYHQERVKDGLNKLMVGFNWNTNSVNLYDLMNDKKQLETFIAQLEDIRDKLYSFFESQPYSANFKPNFKEMAFTLKYTLVGTKNIESYLRVPFSLDFGKLLEKLSEMAGLEENLEYNLRDVSRAFQSLKLDELDESISLKEVRLDMIRIIVNVISDFDKFYAERDGLFMVYMNKK